LISLEQCVIAVIGNDLLEGLERVFSYVILPVLG
jgi:hypothetical protein